jgi:sirohydrochlorin ferrochelatase
MTTHCVTGEILELTRIFRGSTIRFSYPFYRLGYSPYRYWELMTFLIAASHGTDNSVGAASIARLVNAVAHQMEDHDVIEAFVDVQSPSVTDITSALEGDAVVVPLLLSTGYHVRQDIAQAAFEAPNDVAISPALGPDARITQILLRRIEEVSYHLGDALLLTVAGSSDALAVAECQQVARDFSQAVGARYGESASADVHLAFLSSSEPLVTDAVAAVREDTPGRRIIVVTYLLADGFFANKARRAGADVTTEPLLSPTEEPATELVEVIIDRFTRALEPAGQTGCVRGLQGEPWVGCAAGCVSACREAATSA